MTFFKITSLLAAACVLAFTACNSGSDAAGKAAVVQEPVHRALPAGYSEAPGLVGVFDVPEMLVLSRMDSAAPKDMSFQLAKDYSVLQADLEATGAQMVGSPGVINYNNDPANLKFECILVIRDFPAKQPAQSTVVALEASKMLVYNHYGPYEHLGNAYAEIRKIYAEKKLAQTGPMREFYITDPTIENDPKKWLTRIMVPVEQATEPK